MGFYELRPQLVEARQVVIGDKELAKWCYGSYGPVDSTGFSKTFLIFEANDGLTHYVPEGSWVLHSFFNGFWGMSHDEFSTTYREIEQVGEVPVALSTNKVRKNFNLDTHIYDGYHPEAYND